MEAIHRYIKYLQQHNTSMQQVRYQNEPPRTMDDNVSMYTLPASCVSTSDGYKELDDAKAEYCLLCLNDFAPSNR